jgi:hypothetical protein
MKTPALAVRLGLLLVPLFTHIRNNSLRHVAVRSPTAALASSPISLEVPHRGYGSLNDPANAYVPSLEHHTIYTERARPSRYPPRSSS